MGREKPVACSINGVNDVFLPRNLYDVSVSTGTSTLEQWMAFFCSCRVPIYFWNHVANWIPANRVSEWDLLLNITCNDISVIYVTAHRCEGGLKKLDLRSGSQHNTHFVWFFNVTVEAPTRAHPFYTIIPKNRSILSTRLGPREGLGFSRECVLRIPTVS